MRRLDGEGTVISLRLVIVSLLSFLFICFLFTSFLIIISFCSLYCTGKIGADYNMDSDSSPNPIPIPKKHPFQTSLDLLEPSLTDIHSPPPRQMIDGNDMLLTNEGRITESSNIPNVIVTNEDGETLCEKEEKQTGDNLGESDKNSSSKEQCQTPLQTNSTNPLSQSCNSAKQIKYQTKVMFERSVSWIKKVKLVLKDSPLLLFGLASKQTPTLEDVIEQSKIIFEDYLYLRLREAGFGFISGLDNQSIHTSFLGGRELNGLKVSSSNLNPKPILSVWQKGNGEIYEHLHAEFVNLMSAVSVELHNIGMKLETTYPSLYKCVDINFMGFCCFLLHVSLYEGCFKLN